MVMPFVPRHYRGTILGEVKVREFVQRPQRWWVPNFASDALTFWHYVADVEIQTPRGERVTIKSVTLLNAVERVPRRLNSLPTAGRTILDVAKWIVTLLPFVSTFTRTPSLPVALNIAYREGDDVVVMQNGSKFYVLEHYR